MLTHPTQWLPLQVMFWGVVHLVDDGSLLTFMDRWFGTKLPADAADAVIAAGRARRGRGR